MAYISSPTTGFGATILSALASTADAVFNFLADLTSANARMAQIEAMQRMSDEDLMTRYNITRDRIVHYVFRDKMMY